MGPLDQYTQRELAGVLGRLRQRGVDGRGEEVYLKTGLRTISSHISGLSDFVETHAT